MSNTHECDREFLSLMWQVCEGSATPAQCAQLDQQLQQHREARRYYLQYVAMLGDLAAEGNANVTPNAAPPTTSSHPATAGPLSMLGLSGLGLSGLGQLVLTTRFLAPAISTLLVGYFVALLVMLVWERGRHADSLVDRERYGIATITSSRDCHWDGDAPSERLARRKLRLRDGSVQLQFDGGARVNVEGPAEFEVRSSHEAFLGFGKLAAHVPPQAIGFTIDTPTARVVDLGTEFGVDVARSGQTDVHVFTGMVEVAQVSADARATARPMTLSVGQGVRVSGSSGTAVERISANRARFQTAFQPGAADQRPAARQSAVDAIWLSNLLDDSSTVPLAEAVQSDTLHATADIDDLGVERVLYGGSPVRKIAPGVWFDFSNLGWEDYHYGAISNDTWSESGRTDGGFGPEGGFQTRGRKIGRNEPKIEDGIGAHGSSLITFDLDAIRAAGTSPRAAYTFICDRAGVNDYAFEQPLASVHMAVLVSDRSKKLIAAIVDGKPAEVAAGNPSWSVVSPIGAPLRGDGHFATFRVFLPFDAQYLTLSVTNAGDGHEWDTAVWSGARLELAK